MEAFLSHLLPDDLDQPGDHGGPNQSGHEKHDCDANNQCHCSFDASHNYISLSTIWTSTAIAQLHLLSDD